MKAKFINERHEDEEHREDVRRYSPGHAHEDVPQSAPYDTGDKLMDKMLRGLGITMESDGIIRPKTKMSKILCKMAVNDGHFDEVGDGTFILKESLNEELRDWPEQEGRDFSESDYQYSDANRIARELDKLGVDDTVVLVVTKEDDGFFKWKKEKGWV
jgi:hypothetical protein